jgi:hypothetical protein
VTGPDDRSAFCRLASIWAGVAMGNPNIREGFSEPWLNY